MNRTLLYGEGLFETIRWRGVNERLELHYRRLKNSAEFFGIPCPSYEEFVRLIRDEVKDKNDVYVKFCLFSEGSDLFFKESESYSVKVIVKEIPAIPEKVKLGISKYRRHSKNPIIYHKTMNYLFNITVKREALKRGFYDCIILNENDEITECSSSNIILIKGGKMYTPAKDCGLLWGTTLEWLSKRYEIKEERLKLKDLEEAEAIFITNAIIGAVPVEEVEGVKKQIENIPEIKAL